MLDWSRSPRAKRVRTFMPLFKEKMSLYGVGFDDGGEVGDNFLVRRGFKMSGPFYKMLG